MEEPETEEKKHKVTEFKTFSVPFDLEEIKKNLTNHRNTPTQPSQEQKINKARNLHKQRFLQNIYLCQKSF